MKVIGRADSRRRGTRGGSFDDLVGERQKLGRDIEAERLLQSWR
jgi:hypothetical protein